jgi:hypothetical protein
MGCPYFEEGSFGMCCASEQRYVPSIKMMEEYCFQTVYRRCPIFTAYQDHKYQEVS